MTATFSKAVTGFVVGDITVGNGTAGNFVAVSTTVYTFDVTPAGQGVVTVNVAAAVAQDAASNGNTAATQYSITYDDVSPTVILTSTATSPTKTSPIPMTATFSKAVTGFVVGDITVGNGSAGNFVAVSTTVYTFDVTPAWQGVVTVNVAAAVAQDAASNGNTAATQYSITYDTVAPTVTLTSTATSPTKVSPIPMTATFSKAVTGFVVGDITVGNGSAGNFVAVSTTVYTFDVTPAWQGAVTVNVAAAVAQDAASNGNTAATQYSITYDSLPTITSFTTSSADEGYVVIITGTNFTGSTAVKFGDTDALSFTVDSETQITAMVDHGTSGKITVTTEGGTAASADEYASPESPVRRVNWWLIGSIISGVVLIGAIVWSLMILRRREDSILSEPHYQE
jgi:DNA-binding cell septation regulator SpoVG